MSIKFFGQYLLGKYVINAQQLLEALFYQESKNLKFGEYALAKGYITQPELKKILDEQRSRDEKIGEIAQKLNILTAEQVTEILTIQKNDHILIGEALVDKGFITPEILREELELFEADQSTYIPDEITMPSQVSNPEMVIAMVDMTHKMLVRIAQIQAKIDRGIVLDQPPAESYLTVTSSLQSEIFYSLVFSLSSKEIAQAITTGIIGTSAVDEPHEVIVDGAKEFCNIVCGNIIAKMAKIGKKVEIKPPQQVHDLSTILSSESTKRAFYFPIITPTGTVNLLLIEN